MRVLFSLVVLAAGAQALSTSLYQKRSAVDFCANLGCSVSFPNPHSGQPTHFGNLDVCVCLSQIPGLVKSNPILVAASAVFGTSKVTDFITSEVKKQGKSCTYPDHAVPVCSKGNCCDFHCSDGYTPYNGKCVCKAPYKECGGKCGTYTICPSKTPYKRDVDEWKRDVLCDKGYTACGVLGHSKLAQAYECVDARNDLESCGGCSIPLHRGSPMGVDCTSLPGVADVSCTKGSCYIHKCMPGYKLSVDNSMCMDEETVRKFVMIGELGLGHFAPLRLD